MTAEAGTLNGLFCYFYEVVNVICQIEAFNLTTSDAHFMKDGKKGKRKGRLFSLFRTPVQQCM